MGTSRGGGALQGQRTSTGLSRHRSGGGTTAPRVVVVAVIAIAAVIVLFSGPFHRSPFHRGAVRPLPASPRRQTRLSPPIRPTHAPPKMDTSDESKQEATSVLDDRRRSSKRSKNKNNPLATLVPLPTVRDDRKPTTRMGGSDSTTPAPSAAGHGCVAWRQTGLCSPHGPRERHKDLPCDTFIDHDQSGYCECYRPKSRSAMQIEIRIAEVGCSHRPFTCREACHEGDAFDTRNDALDVGLHTCVAFRRTLDCAGDDHGNHLGSAAASALCESIVPDGWSGNCDCGGGTAAIYIPCKHEVTTCSLTCAFGHLTPLANAEALIRQVKARGRGGSGDAAAQPPTALGGGGAAEDSVVIDGGNSEEDTGRENDQQTGGDPLRHDREGTALGVTPAHKHHRAVIEDPGGGDGPQDGKLQAQDEFERLTDARERELREGHGERRNQRHEVGGGFSTKVRGGVGGGVKTLDDLTPEERAKALRGAPPGFGQRVQRRRD